MNGYELSRNWFNWAFDNPELVKPIHAAIYFFALEHQNRLGGKNKFGFPSQMTMDAIGVKKYQTYGKALNELAEWGFIEFIERSKNQYSANIISIIATPKNGIARGKALDKATIKHGSRQGKSIGQGKGSITKPINQEPINQDVEDMGIINNSFFDVEVLKEKYLNNERVVKAVLSEKKNNFNDIEHLKSRLDEFVLFLIGQSETSKTMTDFSSHFRNWNKTQKNNQVDGITYFGNGVRKEGTKFHGIL